MVCLTDEVNARYKIKTTSGTRHNGNGQRIYALPAYYIFMLQNMVKSCSGALVSEVYSWIAIDCS